MMTKIPTWDERCEMHPDHQSGMVTHAMIQMRMQEEIDDLRDEIERLREALRRIADGPRDINKTYAELFAEVKIEARAALGEEK